MKWQLKKNFEKFHVIHLDAKNYNFTYKLDLHNSEVIRRENIFGVLLDYNLSFKEHMCMKL